MVGKAGAKEANPTNQTIAKQKPKHQTKPELMSWNNGEGVS